MKVLIFHCLIFHCLIGFSQNHKTIRLPKEINECSGMIFINDSTLIFHNDSDRPTKLFTYSLTTKSVLKIDTITIQLKDFEAISKNNKLLFLADIGNNLNKRKDLSIHVFDNNSKSLIDNHQISYPDQEAFPPNNTLKQFDAEAIIYQNNQVLIFSKNRTKPYDGICKVYTYDLKSKAISHSNSILFPKKSWCKTSITDACLFQNQYYLLSYQYIFVLDSNFKLLKKHRFSRILQREAIAINSKGTIFVASEKHRVLGGGKIQQIKLK